MKHLHLLTLIGSLLFLQACASAHPHDLREEVAQRISMPTFMMKKDIQTDQFNIRAYEKIHEDGAPIYVYIEGDGLAWLGGNRPSNDPTPTQPTSLQLASKDDHTNVVYLARPCQYNNDTQICKTGNKYWTNGRYAPEVLKAMDQALNDVKSRYNAPSFHLVGYSGGGGIAALLAGTRDDIASLRTVAGNLDHVAFTNIHNVSPMDESLNPINYGDKLRNVPQIHFIGGQDTIVPAGIYHSYLNAIGNSPCIHSELVIDATHEDGWVNQWKDLLNKDVSCTAAQNPQ